MINQLPGKRVRQARKKQGWTQEEVAVRMGMKRQTISALERGKRKLSTQELLGLTRVLGFPWQFFTDPLHPLAQENEVEFIWCHTDPSCGLTKEE